MLFNTNTQVSQSSVKNKKTKGKHNLDSLCEFPHCHESNGFLLFSIADKLFKTCDLSLCISKGDLPMYFYQSNVFCHFHSISLVEKQSNTDLNTPKGMLNRRCT